MGINAKIYKTDGTDELIVLNSFKDLQRALAGDIGDPENTLAELVTTDNNGIQTWANEEGLLLNMPINPTISFNNGFFEQGLVGPIVQVMEQDLNTLPYGD